MNTAPPSTPGETNGYRITTAHHACPRCVELALAAYGSVASRGGDHVTYNSDNGHQARVARHALPASESS